MNPFYTGSGNSYMPYRIYEQFSSMQMDLVNISFDDTSVPSKSNLGKNLTSFCFVCSGTKAVRGRLVQYNTVYQYNTMLGEF